jgi:glutathione synthase/RimK-type ligase-like ATP-grasp enzyme
MKRVAIFAEPDDIHGLTVARRLVDEGADPIIVNTASLARDWRSNFELNGKGSRFMLANEGSVIDFDDLTGVWLRRTPQIKVDDAVAQEEIRRFCVGEFAELFEGASHQFTNVINHPSADRRANRKVLQLAAAREVGFKVPETLISNDANRIRDFIDNCPSGVVFKILSNTRFQFTESRPFLREHLPLLRAAQLAPTIFQARVTPREHLRVTAVDGELFVASIKSERPEAICDWRLDHSCTISRGTLRPEDAERVRALQSRFGLRYGALDLIVDQDGDAWFLENNPGGQFLFVEIHAKLPISNAIARALLNGARA